MQTEVLNSQSIRRPELLPEVVKSGETSKKARILRPLMPLLRKATYYIGPEQRLAPDSKP